MKQIAISPIGIIRTPFHEISGMPIQPSGAAGVLGTIELDAEYQEGLLDLSGFSHIMLLYHFHRVSGYRLHVIPFMDTVPHGIFATRAPVRPNAIGISVVKLEKIEGRILSISDVDMLDGTPLLDIKPFFPVYDMRMDAKGGWLDGLGSINISAARSDGRFAPE